jgi:rhamnogalacturonyl hydrolase YesR
MPTTNNHHLESVTEKVKRALLAMQRHSWEQGVTAQAFLELGETDLVILMAKEAVVRQSEDGRMGVMGSNHAVTDPVANGEAVAFAANATGERLLHIAVEKMVDYLINQAPKTINGTLHHIVTKPQVWIDSMYMAPPFLTVTGHSEEAVKQIEGFRDLLWLPEKQLFAHMWDDNAQTFLRKACWGVGNGWAAAGMTRVIRALPAEMVKDKQRLAGYVRQVLDGCLIYQEKDGLFHDIVDDPSSFVETNLAQMLAYTIYRGVSGGWLNESYLDSADLMRQAAHSKVDKYGLVQDVCGAPHFNHPGTAPEGQAFFLLMEAAFRDYSTSKLGEDNDRFHMR